MSHTCQNRVYQINSEIGIDIGMTTFTVRPGDIIIFGESQVEEIIYTSPNFPHKQPLICFDGFSKIPNPTHSLKLTGNKVRLAWSAWYLNKWIGFTQIIENGAMSDITTKYKRDKLIESIL